MITVKFNEPDEFIDEIRREKDSLEGRILRITNQYRQSKSLPLHYVSVIATALARGQIIRMEKYVGETAGMGEEDKKTVNRAGSVQDDLKTAAAEMGLEVRAGIYQDREEIP